MIASGSRAAVDTSGNGAVERCGKVARTRSRRSDVMIPSSLARAATATSRRENPSVMLHRRDSRWPAAFAKHHVRLHSNKAVRIQVLRRSHLDPRARPAGRRGRTERLRQVERHRRGALGARRDAAPALRGDSMQDVIFNGSVNRKPLARAAVELIFDNAQGRAAGAVVAVRRDLGASACCSATASRATTSTARTCAGATSPTCSSAPASARAPTPSSSRA